MKTKETTMTPQHQREQSQFGLRSNLVLLAFLVIGGFYLLTEHTAHLFGILPYLLVLLCPLLHLLHGGHGGHGHHENSRRQTEEDPR